MVRAADFKGPDNLKPPDRHAGAHSLQQVSWRRRALPARVVFSWHVLYTWKPLAFGKNISDLNLPQFKECLGTFNSKPPIGPLRPLCPPPTVVRLLNGGGRFVLPGEMYAFNAICDSLQQREKNLAKKNFLIKFFWDLANSTSLSFNYVIQQT